MATPEGSTAVGPGFSRIFQPLQKLDARILFLRTTETDVDFSLIPTVAKMIIALTYER